MPVRDKRAILPGYTAFSIATDDFIEQYFGDESNGIAILCGPRSGGLLALDLDADKYLPALQRDLPALANTFTVGTPRGGHHLYYQINDKLLRNADLSHKLPGVELRYRGLYIVAPPSSGYTPVNDLPVLEINADDYGLLYEWAKAQTNRNGTPLQPAPKPSPKPASSAVQQRHQAPLLPLAEQLGSRNEALFKLACLARDRGMSAKEFAEGIAPEFLSARPVGNTRIQTAERRYKEMIATIKSAFSRQARTGIKPQTQQLSDALRQALVQRGLTNVWLLLDRLYKAHQPGATVTAAAAIELGGGRDSTRAALAALDELTRSSPPYTLQEATRLPTGLTQKEDKECYTVGIKSQEKFVEAQKRGRKPTLYRIPSPDELAAILGVSGKVKASKLEYASSKEARLALYKAKIERTPGTYSNAALAQWFGLSINTIKAYEKAVKISRIPQYDEVQITSWNIKALPFVIAPKMGLWIQAGKKRYVATQENAEKLLKFGQAPRLMKQLPNYYTTHQQPRPMILPTIPAPRTFPKPAYAPVGANLPNQPKAAVAAPIVLQDEPKPRRPTALETLKARWQEYEPQHPGDVANRLALVDAAVGEHLGFSAFATDSRAFNPRWLGQKTPRAIVRWLSGIERPAGSSQPAALTHTAKDAQVTELRRLLVDQSSKPVLSGKTASWLIGQYGAAQALAVAQDIAARGKIRNPAGLLVSILRSNQKAREFKRLYGGVK